MVAAADAGGAAVEQVALAGEPARERGVEHGLVQLGGVARGGDAAGG